MFIHETYALLKIVANFEVRCACLSVCLNDQFDRLIFCNIYSEPQTRSNANVHYQSQKRKLNCPRHIEMDPSHAPYAKVQDSEMNF